MRTFREIAEAMRKMGDDAMDLKLKGKDVMTFKYDDAVAMEFAKSTDVYATKDKKFFHIEKDSKNKNIAEIIKEFNLKEV